MEKAYVAESAETKKQLSKIWLAMPIIISIITIVCDMSFPDHDRLKYVDKPYFVYAMIAVTIVFTICAIAALCIKRYRDRYLPKTPFLFVMIFVLNIGNLITAKTAILPKVYFPHFDDILYTYIQFSDFLKECIVESCKLYLYGVIIGTVAGILIGVLIGWSKRANYWIFPVIRFIGPIPTSVWVPFAILFFPSLAWASRFVVAMSMAFPVIVMTSSGIQNIPKHYFEVGSILGASEFYQITRIAIPAAMPQIFVGLFNGVSLAFMSLMVAELIGVHAGIGWYINWQQKMMSFPDVYAGLLLLALLCFFVMKLLFLFRKRFLSWQEGAIRW